MAKAKQRNSRLDVARRMPPLKHSVPGQKFSIARSEVAQWLMNQPEIWQMVFDAAKDRGVIVYDSNERVWKGVDYAD